MSDPAPGRHHVEIKSESPSRFSFAARIRSFGHAYSGIGFMLRTQHNAWLHLSATVGVLAAALLLKVRADDWRWLVSAIAVVWVAEAFNTAVEYLCDVVSPSYSVAVKRAKDIAAGSVLISACGAALIGVLTFLPYLRAVRAGRRFE